MSEFDEGESDIPVVRKIIHEVRDKDYREQQAKKTKKQQETQDEDEKVHEEWFQDFKRNLAESKPELKDKILSAQSGYELEGILEDAKEDNEQPSPHHIAPKGKATLIQEPDLSNSLDRAKDEGSLINRLYSKAKTRAKQEQELKDKQLALERINQLRKSMSEHIPEKHVKESIEGYCPCPSCGNVVNVNFNRKGATCPVCGFVSGQGNIRKRYV